MWTGPVPRTSSERTPSRGSLRTRLAKGNDESHDDGDDRADDAVGDGEDDDNGDDNDDDDDDDEEVERSDEVDRESGDDEDDEEEEMGEARDEVEEVSLRVSLPSELSLSLSEPRWLKWCSLGRPPTVRWFIPRTSVRSDDSAASCGTLPYWSTTTTNNQSQINQINQPSIKWVDSNWARTAISFIWASSSVRRVRNWTPLSEVRPLSSMWSDSSEPMKHT